MRTAPQTDFSNLFSNCNCFYFAQNVLWKLFYSDTGTSRFAGEVFLINCIECSEICHISKETGCLYNVVKCKASLLKDCSYVLAGLLCLSFDLISCNFACCRVYRDLSGCEYKVSYHFTCEYGPIAAGAFLVSRVFMINSSVLYFLHHTTKNFV